MSNSPTLPTDRLPRLDELADAWPLERGLDAVATPLRFVAFWAAVALPFLYLPLLIGGLQGEQATAFVALLSVNVAALVIGHEHGR
ncbi:hypothetical protein [Haloplanus halobius]|uniref:hypothetical protein n=1 Tax=Haloplanus halobius TaxID=2934938 RepID=UPI00200C6564|nr:hypothetical protein [Haloplanus sp. XH21]